MKRVTAYEALDGTCHRSKAGAAKASILHLSVTKNDDARGQSLGSDAIAFIIQHHNQIASILIDIDAEDEAPDCDCLR